MRNGLKTAVLLGALSGIVIGIGALLGGTTGVIIAAVLALGINGYAYYNSDKLAIKAMQAREVTEYQAPELYAMVRELSHKANQPMPRLYIAPTQQPNAFATGRNPQNAAVAVTEGILRILSPRELRGVIGHELSHVYNRDILISSVAGALASMITSLTYILYFRGAMGRGGGNPLVILALMLLAPMAAGIIRMGVSRSREYQADKSGAELTGDPMALASALKKIERGVDQVPMRADSPAASEAHLMISNPLRGGGMANLFRTHPPTEDRVQRLQAMSRGIR
ncbi:zinc metalloprotease HtpX [Natronoglycomyces albus]|uniref:Protease HtpX homolog n=1 Tax=Natronoglycomyces albus TaxID=2811108 RepID=A0A895XKE7_9ACTN|nr:zinc metalloprotease HtpX [Natronoglycomyces albus]QSB05814.1 zinc metalloprotease HtpX [Natronoglycomyces albus]